MAEHLHRKSVCYQSTVALCVCCQFRVALAESIECFVFSVVSKSFALKYGELQMMDHAPLIKALFSVLSHIVVFFCLLNSDHHFKIVSHFIFFSAFKFQT